MITVKTLRIMQQGVKLYRVVSITAPEWGECPAKYIGDKDVALFGHIKNRIRPELYYYTSDGDSRTLLYVGCEINEEKMHRHVIPRIKAAVDLLRRTTAEADEQAKEWCDVCVTFEF